MPESSSYNTRAPRFNWLKWERFVRRLPENSYSREVSSLAELPEAARLAVEARLADGEAVQQMIFAPYQTVLSSQPVLQRRGIRLLPWEYTHDRVIVLTNRQLITVDLEESGRAGEVSCAPLETILSMQSGKILLFSWLDWTWVEGGAARSLRCYFNTVCEGIYFRLAEGVRCQTAEPGSLRPVPPGERSEQLKELPYKFRNMLPLYLLNGEALEQVIYRPSIWERRARFWRIHRLPKAALLLTGAHLLIAEEELTSSEDAYGLIVTFLPRGRVKSMLVETAASRTVLRIQTGLHEVQHETRFAAQVDLQKDLETLAGKF